MQRKKCPECLAQNGRHRYDVEVSYQGKTETIRLLALTPKGAAFWADTKMRRYRPRTKFQVLSVKHVHVPIPGTN